MKISTVYTAAFAVIALATFTIPTLAQTGAPASGDSANTAAQGKRQKRGNKGENPLAARFNKRIGEKLNLTEEQKNKIKAIQKETRDKMLPILREEMTQIRATLTDEQKKQLATAMAEQRKRMGNGGAAGGIGAGAGNVAGRRPGGARRGNGTTSPPTGVDF